MSGAGHGGDGRSRIPLAIAMVAVAAVLIVVTTTVALLLAHDESPSETAATPTSSSAAATSTGSSSGPATPPRTTTSAPENTAQQPAAVCEAGVINRDLGYPDSGARIIDCAGGWAVMASAVSGDPFWVSFHDGRWHLNEDVSIYTLTCPEEAIALGAPGWLAYEHLSCEDVTRFTTAPAPRPPAPTRTPDTQGPSTPVAPSPTPGPSRTTSSSSTPSTSTPPAAPAGAVPSRSGTEQPGE